MPEQRMAMRDGAAEGGVRLLPNHARPPWQEIGDRVVAAAHAARSVARRALFREDWNLGIIDAPAYSLLNGWDPACVRWLPRREGDRFLADPFGIALTDGRTLVLAEEFVGSMRRGRLVAGVIEGARWQEPPASLLELKTHLSYPYIVRDESGALFCIPESSAAGELVRYKLDVDHRQMQRDRVLLEGVPAVDATPFQWDGRWWLLATRADIEPDSHLFAWHASNLEGPWIEHSLNPIKRDARSARPAGTPFVVEGSLFRPAQDDSGQYGGALVINRVTMLAPDAFEEEAVTRLEPDPHGPYPSGIHTLSVAGDIVLVDGKAYRFAPLAKVLRRAPGWVARASSRKWRQRR